MLVEVQMLPIQAYNVIRSTLCSKELIRCVLCYGNTVKHCVQCYRQSMFRAMYNDALSLKWETILLCPEPKTVCLRLNNLKVNTWSKLTYTGKCPVLSCIIQSCCIIEIESFVWIITEQEVWYKTGSRSDMVSIYSTTKALTHSTTTIYRSVTVGIGDYHNRRKTHNVVW